MNKVTLPNQELITELFENYYSSHNTPDKLISSHWKYYSEKFNVELDRKGNLISLRGMGFGDMVDGPIVSRILAYICHISYFVRLPYKKDLFKLIIESISICNSMGVYFSFDCFKQACSLSLIKRNLSESMKNKHLIFLVIGDGYGFLSSLIKRIFPDSTIVLVDLGKTLLFQVFYCQKVHPDCVHYGINQMNTINKKEVKFKQYDFIYCPTEFLDKVAILKYDVIINIASMQEMNFSTIERYFNFIRNCSNIENLFYCCNRERKALLGGEILEFEKYPWHPKDRHLIDEYCPWYKYFFSLARAENGPKVFDIRLPFLNFFDGPIRHRLTIIAKNSNHE